MFARAGAVVGLVALAGTVMLRADQPRSPRNANYTIDARLDPATRTIQGDETLRWTNITAHPATSLQFHLYYNAWRDTNSTWMRERSLASGDRTERRADEWGSTNIDAISLVTLAPGAVTPGPDLTSRLRFIAPDDGNTADRTVVELPLDRPVGPGESATVQIRWTAHVPRTFARTGAIGDFFFIAQWFPKLGVLEDTGWNTHQFHSATEFYSDFGVYDVHLAVPAGWTVGATGTEQDVQRGSDGTETHHFYQEDVHDFAWTTSPHYLVRTERFEDPPLPPVDMRLLLQPEHADQAERHFAATRAALKYYGEWYGPYPYGHITIVDPAYQSGAGGMEYPTLFTAGTRWLAPPGPANPESVTVHEAGHQFWYGIVANNEFENAWMDEGFNTFSTARTLWRVFAPYYYSQRYFGGFVPWNFKDVLIERGVGGDGMPSYRPAARRDIEATPTFRYWPPTAGSITYSKTALWLHTLENYLGWPTMQRVMATYFQRYAFKHPRPDDFFAVANEVSGQDLNWYFDQVYRGSQVFDYGVDLLRSDKSANGYRTSVAARRLSDGIFPVNVRVTFDDGQHTDWRWDGRDQWKLFQVEHGSRAVSAEVDPDRVLVLDVNRTNNSVTLQPEGSKAARKWSFAWLVWVQDQLMTYGFFV